MGTGLVLEGGALRGLFTSGILDVMMENGIGFEAAVGVSAGVALGCNLKSKQIGRAIRYNKRFSHDWHYRSFRSLIFTGDLYGAEFCYHTMPGKLDVFDTETFKSNPMDFYAVATDVVTGEPVYHKLTDGGNEDLEWIRASASMPLASRVVEINGLKLLDGGISDSIPLRFMEDKGFTKNVVILTQPIDYVKHRYKIMPVIRAALHKYPNTVRLLDTRHEMYNSQTDYVKVREEEGTAFVIRPPQALNISALEKDPLQMQRVYDIGRTVALEKLSDIKRFMDS